MLPNGGNLMKFYTNDNRDIRFNYFFWVGLLIIMLIRSFYFGIEYFNFLDDYNTYGVFNRRNDDIFNNIIVWYGLYTFRPIAFLADAYITQWFWNNMWVVLMFYTLMHFATVIIFYKVLRASKINLGAFGIIIISLTPILFEAVYWIGASTRLVSGMFFSIISSYFLIKYLGLAERRIYNNKYLVLYVFFNFISTGFYEQVVAFNFIFTLIIIFLNYYRIHEKLKLIVSIPILSTISIALFYYLLAPYGKVQSRGELVPFRNIGSHFISVSGSIFNLLTNTNHDINKNGFFRGITLIDTFWQWAGLIFVIIFTIVVIFSLLKTYLVLEDRYDDNYLLCIIIGVILIISPFAPFYIIQNSFMAPRTIYPSIFGIAIILDTFLSMISTIKISTFKLTALKPIISGILIIPFFIIYIAEINNFKLLEEVDTIVMDNFLETFAETGIDEETTIILFNTKYTYADTTTQGHRLENVTSSDWALMGKANATSESFYFRDIQPIQSERLLPKEWTTNDKGLFGIDEELNVYHLELRNNILYINNTNTIFGTIEDYDNDLVMFIRNN